MVCGLKNAAIQKRLLSEANLTLARAMEIAQGMEAAEQSTKKLQGESETVPVQRVTPHGKKAGGSSLGKSRSEKKACYRCGGTDYAPSSCRFRNLTCHKCRKRGHIAKMCKSRPPGGNQSQKSVGVVEQAPAPAPSEDEVDKELTMFHMTNKPQRPIVVTGGEWATSADGA